MFQKDTGGSNLQSKIVTQSKCFEKQVDNQKVSTEIEIK